jgi:hypothetical protein
MKGWGHRLDESPLDFGSVSQQIATHESVPHPWKHNGHPIGVRLESELCSAGRTPDAV